MEQFISNIRVTKDTSNDTNGEFFQGTLLTLLKSAFPSTDKPSFLCAFLLKKISLIELITVLVFEKFILTIISPINNRREENLDVGSPSVLTYS